MTATYTKENYVASEVIMIINDAFPSEYATGPALTCDLIARQLSLKFLVNILTTNYDRLRKIRLDKGALPPDHAAKKINRVFLTRGFKKYIELISFLRARQGPIFLHCLFEYRLVLPSFVIALLLGRREIYHLPHGMLLDVVFEKHKLRKMAICLLLEFCLSKYLIHLASSELEKRDILEKIGHNQTVVVIPQPVEVNFKSVPSSFRGRTPGSPLRICSVGRVTKQKNYIFVLETLKQIEFETVWNIYGDIEDLAYFKSCMELVYHLPSQIKCNFRGSLDRNNLMDEVAHNDLLFSPTLGENHGHAILEAMGMGCPVLISNRCPWTDVNAHGAGWSYDLNDRQLFIEALRTAYHSGPDWAKARQAASDYFIEKQRLSKGKYIELLLNQIGKASALNPKL